MSPRRNWDSPKSQPLSLSSECAPLPPRTGERGGTLACGWGVGRVSKFWRLEKSLALCLLCAFISNILLSVSADIHSPFRVFWITYPGIFVYWFSFFSFFLKSSFFPYCSHSLDPFTLFFPLASFSSFAFPSFCWVFLQYPYSYSRFLSPHFQYYMYIVYTCPPTYIHLNGPLLFIVSPLYSSSSLSLHIWNSLLNHPFLSSFLQSFHSPLHPPPPRSPLRPPNYEKKWNLRPNF